MKNLDDILSPLKNRLVENDDESLELAIKEPEAPSSDGDVALSMARLSDVIDMSDDLYNTVSELSSLDKETEEAVVEVYNNLDTLYKSVNEKYSITSPEYDFDADGIDDLEEALELDNEMPVPQKITILEPEEKESIDSREVSIVKAMDEKLDSRWENTIDTDDIKRAATEVSEELGYSIEEIVEVWVQYSETGKEFQNLVRSFQPADTSGDLEEGNNSNELKEGKVSSLVWGVFAQTLLSKVEPKEVKKAQELLKIWGSWKDKFTDKDIADLIDKLKTWGTPKDGYFLYTIDEIGKIAAAYDEPKADWYKKKHGLKEARKPKEGDMVIWNKKGPAKQFSLELLDKDGKTAWLADDDGEEYEAKVKDLTVAESTELTEGMLTVQKLRKIFMNADDWGEDIKNQIYIEGGRLVFIDSYYYGGDKALASLVKSWKPGGSYYDYFKKNYGAHIQVVNSFQEIKATGRHKKLTTNGIVGVELKVESGSDTSQVELEEAYKKGEKVKILLNPEDEHDTGEGNPKAKWGVGKIVQSSGNDEYEVKLISGDSSHYKKGEIDPQVYGAQLRPLVEIEELTEASATPAPTKTKVGNTNWLSSAEYDLVRKKPWFKEDEWEWDSEMTLYGRKTMKETKVLSIPQAKQLTFLDSKQYNQIKKKYGFKAEDWSWNAERKLYEKAVDTYTTLYARLSERFLGEKVGVDFKNKETGDIVAPRNQKLNAKKLKEIAELLVANNCKLAFNRENQDEANSIAEIIKGEDSLQEQKKQPTKRLESFLS